MGDELNLGWFFRFLLLDYEDLYTKMYENIDFPEWIALMCKHAKLPNFLLKKERLVGIYYNTDYSFFMIGPDRVKPSRTFDTEPFSIGSNIYIKEKFESMAAVYEEMVEEEILFVFYQLVKYLYMYSSVDIPPDEITVVKFQDSIPRYKLYVINKPKSSSRKEAKGHLEFLLKYYRTPTIPEVLDLFSQSMTDVVNFYQRLESSKVIEWLINKSRPPTSSYGLAVKYGLSREATIMIESLIAEDVFGKELIIDVDQFLKNQSWHPEFPVLSPALIDDLRSEFYKNARVLSKYTQYYDGLVNGNLRNQSPTSEFSMNIIAGILRVLDQTKPIDVPYTLYRGTDLYYTERIDYGFSSKSSSLEVAKNFALEAENPAVMIVYYPPGTKQLALSDVSKFPDEQEFLTYPGETLQFIREFDLDGILYQEYRFVGYQIMKPVLDTTIDAAINARIAPFFDLYRQKKFQYFYVAEFRKYYSININVGHNFKALDSKDLYDLVFGYAILNDKPLQFIVLQTDRYLDVTDIIDSIEKRDPSFTDVLWL